MQTIQYRKSRIQEIKEDKYAKGLAKNQVCAIFHMRDIWENVLPKFIKLCMETPCLCPFEGHKHGCRKPTMCFLVFPLVREFIAWESHKGLKWYLFWDKECSDSKVNNKGAWAKRNEKRILAGLRKWECVRTAKIEPDLRLAF